MDTPIRMPFLERRRDNLHIQKSVQPNAPTPSAAQAFLANSFVKLAAGVLVPCVTDETVCYGWSHDSSHLSTEMPPQALYGQNHWPFDPKDCLFVMNITNTAGKIGQANGAPQLSTAVVGTAYNLYTEAAVAGLIGMQMLNTSLVTAPFARVVALYPNQALTDYNGLVLVELVPTVIQA